MIECMWLIWISVWHAFVNLDDFYFIYLSLHNKEIISCVWLKVLTIVLTSQLGSNAIVLTSQQGVHASQHQLFVDSNLT